MAGGALSPDELTLVISRAPCILKERARLGASPCVDAGRCKVCGACLKLGCPALELSRRGEPPRVNGSLCNGCGLCAQVCRFSALTCPGTGEA